MKLKYKNLLAVILVVTQVLNCAGTGKRLIYRAVEKSDVDIEGGKAGLIRTVYCDIYIEYVDDEGWGYIKKSDIFRGRGHGNPANPCFHFIIVNTWNKPFIIDKIEILYNGEIYPSEDFSFIKDKNYVHNRYSQDLSLLMKKRRILSENNLVNNIDFENDTLMNRKPMKFSK